MRAMAARFLPVVAGLGLRRMSVSAGRAAGLLGSPEAALAGKQKWEVFRGWLVFKLLTYDWIVQNGLTVRHGAARGIVLDGILVVRLLLKEMFREYGAF